MAPLHAKGARDSQSVDRPMPPLANA